MFSGFQISNIKKQNIQIHNKNNTWIECTTFRKYVYVKYMWEYIYGYVNEKTKKMLYNCYI